MKVEAGVDRGAAVVPQPGGDAMTERARGTSSGSAWQPARAQANAPRACFVLDGCLCHVVQARKGARPERVIGQLQLDGRRYVVVPAEAGRTRSVERLTRREREIALLVAEGLLTKQIAHRLGLSPHTVGAYVNRIYARLGCHNRAEMVALMLGHAPLEAPAAAP
jgi:DNA-binding CsgD family transcriptional regulator